MAYGVSRRWRPTPCRGVRAYGRAHCGASSPRMIGRGANSRAYGPDHGQAHVYAIDATPPTPTPSPRRSKTKGRRPRTAHAQATDRPAQE
ncbi:unnamed protein product [Pelagomonas calceolata]|uniref:Uncharacterized protein n=1 Tax=Pelagomonas calceolata TaxID=35677 RepID=A0A8J2SG14_9STRA|nr:unnamed protein product [Pelagomonas calceolata]